MNDLMAWNADATRMPYRMHSEYLRHLFLDNDLAEGRYVVDGAPIALTDIRVPIFAVGTETRPRRAVALGLQDPPADRHRGHLPADQRRPQRRHRRPSPAIARRQLPRSRTRARATITTSIRTPGWPRRRPKTGSWWPEWVAWLAAHSGRAGAAAGDGRAERRLCGRWATRRGPTCGCTDAEKIGARASTPRSKSATTPRRAASRPRWTGSSALPTTPSSTR